jgi:rubredoxin
MKNKWITTQPVSPNDTIFDDAPQPIKCPECYVGYLDVIHDQYGLHMKCPHCKWDSASLYKTRNRYGNK